MRALLTSILSLFASASLAAEPPPVSSFTNFAKYELVKISPNGTHLAFTRHMPDHEIMTVLRLSDLTATTQSHFGDRIDIFDFDWASDSRLLISPTRRFPGLVAYKAPTGEIIGLDADGKDAEVLFGYQAGVQQIGTRVQQRESVYAPARFLARIPGNATDVLIYTEGYSYEGDFNSVYRMNIRTGLLKKVAGSPIRDGRFRTDSTRRVALVSGDNREGDNHVYYRGSDSDPWKLLSDTPMGKGYLWPVSAAASAGEYYALDNRDAPTLGVIAWTPETNQGRLLFRNPQVDAALEGVDPTGKAWGFWYEDHFPRWWYPDPEHPLARMHQWLVKSFPDREVGITSATDDMKLAVARVSGPRMPPTFFVVDVAQQKLLHQLKSRPELAPEQLAVVEPIEFKARDGRIIRGYLTLPNGPQQTKLPMIVMVHGGPHGVFDVLDFDYEAQLFASRGYVVLQVNFRGSGGRGIEFEGAGLGRWGREMQDDVTDGVRWAIGDGVADAKRICIYGGSYGAYAALTGAFREPDLFRCAVGMAGVYDLPLLFEKGDIQTLSSGLRYLRMAVGTDEEELKRRSPVYNADKIKARVLLLHGKLDERAPFEHAKRMRDALQKAGNPAVWSTEWGEGHGFFDEANRLAAYELMLQFFAQNMPVTGGG